MAQSRTKHYGVALCLIISLFVGSSSAVCCSEGDTKVDADDCTKYLICCHGEFVSKSCASGSYWNSEIEICVVDDGQCRPPTCVDGEITPNPDDCAGYLECVNGNEVILTCPDGDYFNSTLNQCVEDTCGVCISCTEGSKKADLNDCSKFQICVNGKYVPQSCAAGYYWNVLNKECEVDDGQCNGNGTTCTDGELKVDPTNCAGYLACSNGNWVSKQCADGAYFNVTLESCVPDDEGICVKCNEGSTKPLADCTMYEICSGGKYVTKSCDTGYYWNHQSEVCDVDNGQCNGNGTTCTDGELKVDPTNCAAYLACSNGNWVSKQCADGAYFNVTLESCVPDDEGICVNCNEGSTKPLPDCTMYEICSGGKYVTKSCDTGYYWNHQSEVCDVDNGQCNGNGTTCTDGELKVDPTNCAGYLACSNGNWVSKQCADGAYFNVTLESCVPDDEGICVKCNEGSTKPLADCTMYEICSGGKYVTKSCDTGYYWNHQSEVCDVDNGQCNGNGTTCTDGELKVDPTNCAGYLACSNGNWVSKQCADGAYFNVTLESCVPDDEGICVKCNEGFTKPLADCTMYEICSGGKYVTKSCDTGYYWNHQSEVCDVDNGQCNGNGTTCTENEVKVNPADCAGYLQCINGNFVARKCSASQFFNATLNECEVDTQNVCIPKTCDPDCCDVPNNSIWPVEKNCSAFYQCVNGNKYDQRCSNNLQYNSVIEQCDYPENVKCDDESAPPSGPNAGPSGTYCESHGRCVGQRDGTMFSDASGDCSSKYVVCQCECEVNFTCSSGLLYNSQVKSCDWPDNVKC
ncbi:chitin-binding domain protein cbd-1 [Drosophila sechellia]|uniref:chitin-binding domain protein cbd-1 n=1 Tax=Drosophila sechellia TaxID=7238 RepID=UPI0013DD982F|nr:chitin-binding domain protein cbd-1 [Drosophila sechellia]